MTEDEAQQIARESITQVERFAQGRRFMFVCMENPNCLVALIEGEPHKRLPCPTLTGGDAGQVCYEANEILGLNANPTDLAAIMASVGYSSDGVSRPIVPRGARRH
jgi:hypothetical protein